MKKRMPPIVLSAVLLGIGQTDFAGEIHDAVRAGDLAKVKALVAKDPKIVNEKDPPESLKPKVVFPIHAGSREYMYGAFARKAAEKRIPSRVICPENKGDRFMLF